MRTQPRSHAVASDQAHLPTLDGWRAIAILGVLCAHTSFGFATMQSWQLQGGLGVDLFFAISGLIITNLLLDERRRTGTISLRAFYIRRAFRILPPAWVFLSTIALLSSLKLIFSTPTGLLSSALCFRNYSISDPRDWFTGHFWSLSVEEHFYLIWPFLLILLLAARVRMLVPVLAIINVLNEWANT